MRSSHAQLVRLLRCIVALSLIALQCLFDVFVLVASIAFVRHLHIHITTRNTRKVLNRAQTSRWSTMVHKSRLYSVNMRR
jgi:hypothetical protein